MSTNAAAPSSGGTRPLRVAIVDLEPRIDDLTTRHLMPRHGVIEVATAVRKAGHDVAVYVERLNGVHLDELPRFDVVGAAVTASNLSRVEELFGRLRRVQPGIALVAGGPHATQSPAEVARLADVVVRDEGEVTLPEVLRALQRNAGLDGIEGISFLRGGRVQHNPRRALPPSPGEVDDLSVVEGFRRRATLSEALLRGPVASGYATTSPGGRLPRASCHEDRVDGAGVRRDGVEVFIENVRRRRDFFGVRHFWLADSDFNTSHGHCREILQAIAESDLGCRFSALCNADIGRQPELLELMERAGFETVALRMDAPGEGRSIDLQEKQAAAGVLRAISAIRWCGLTVMGLFTAGSDEDDLRTPDRIVDFCDAHGVDHVSIHCLTELPELPGRTLPRTRICELDLDYYSGHFVTTFPLRARPSELEAAVFDALLRFYRPSKLLARVRGRGVDEGLRHLALHAQVRAIARVSERHQEKLRRVEAPYYGSDGRLLVARLRERPIVYHPLKADVLAGWRDPEDRAAPRAVTGPGAAERALQAP